MNNALNPKITMMTTVSANSIAGRVVLNGQEWAIKPFEVALGASASEKEKALVKRACDESDERAINERMNDGQKPVAISVGEL